MARVLASLVLGLFSHSLPAAESWLTEADYRLQQRISLEAVSEDASGLSYDPIRQRLWLVTDNAALHELDSNGRWLRHIQLQGFDDPEGVAWLSSDKGITRLAISEERRGQILSISIGDDTQTAHVDNAALLAQFSKQGSNHGIEGLAWDATGQTLYAVSENNPQAVYRINRGNTTELWRLRWFDLWRGPLDYAGVAYVPQTRTLLIVSDRSRELREYALDGRELGRLELDASDPEGVALAPDGTLYICSEPNLLLIYKPQL